MALPSDQCSCEQCKCTFLTRIPVVAASILPLSGSVQPPPVAGAPQPSPHSPAGHHPAAICPPSPYIPASLLYSGTRYTGHQKSKGSCYDVEVLMHSVDTVNHTLCGYLIIKGLTDDYPTMTTFFTGEVIMHKHPFLTRKWDADQEIDRRHWGKFAAFAHVSD